MKSEIVAREFVKASNEKWRGVGCVSVGFVSHPSSVRASCAAVRQLSRRYSVYGCGLDFRRQAWLGP